MSLGRRARRIVAMTAMAGLAAWGLGGGPAFAEGESQGEVQALTHPEEPKDELPKDKPPKDELPKDKPPKDELPKDKPPKDELPKVEDEDVTVIGVRVQRPGPEAEVALLAERAAPGAIREPARPLAVTGANLALLLAAAVAMILAGAGVLWTRRDDLVAERRTSG
jgi:hypothetical protein